MRIGVKYCGGCNPKYDRSALARRLAAALPDHSLEPVRAGEDYDLLLVISGCHVECADLSGIRYRLGPVMVSREEQLQAAVEAIENAEK